MKTNVTGDRNIVIQGSSGNAVTINQTDISPKLYKTIEKQIAGNQIKSFKKIEGLFNEHVTPLDENIKHLIAEEANSAEIQRVRDVKNKRTIIILIMAALASGAIYGISQKNTQELQYELHKNINEEIRLYEETNSIIKDIDFHQKVQIATNLLVCNQMQKNQQPTNVFINIENNNDNYEDFYNETDEEDINNTNDYEDMDEDFII